MLSAGTHCVLSLTMSPHQVKEFRRGVWCSPGSELSLSTSLPVLPTREGGIRTNSGPLGKSYFGGKNFFFFSEEECFPSS